MGRWQLPPKGGHMDKRTGIYLQTMTMRDIEERLRTNDVLIVPLGATEAHGPNAPIGEDIFLVTRMAEAVAERTGCTVSEPLWFGSHPYHHLGMPGTVVIPEDIFCGFVRAMIAGFWNMGFRKQILLNGHGQEYVIPVAIHQFGKRYRVPALVVNVNWYHAIPDQFKLKAQGGPFEVKAYIEGVVGKPSLAQAEKALPGVEALLDYLEKLVNDIMKTFPPGQLPPIEYVTERDKEELDAVLKGPAKGGTSIFSLGWPP